jgi:hypothetical protein
VTEEVAYQPEAIEKHLSSPGLASHVLALCDALAVVEPFDETHIEAGVRDTATALGIKAGLLIHATRVAVTGRTSSPGLFELLALIGRASTLSRLNRLRRFLVARQSISAPVSWNSDLHRDSRALRRHLGKKCASLRPGVAPMCDRRDMFVSDCPLVR